MGIAEMLDPHISARHRRASTVPALMKGGPVRPVACRPYEDVLGGRDRKWSVIFCLIISSSGVHVPSTAGHPQSSVAELEQDTTGQITKSEDVVQTYSRNRP